MKEENLCFFSVSLENGITITGENPTEVLKFLQETHSAYHELWNYYIQHGMHSLEETAAETMDYIDDAIITIDKHLNN